LLVNFGSQSQSPIPPPNTLVPGQPDEGGGSINNAEVSGIGSLVAYESGGTVLATEASQPVLDVRSITSGSLPAPCSTAAVPAPPLSVVAQGLMEDQILDRVD
jgi:hypothetical protein